MRYSTRPLGSAGGGLTGKLQDPHRQLCPRLSLAEEPKTAGRATRLNSATRGAATSTPMTFSPDLI